jgi:phospholipid/cholesterol/gamma-HCH transport system substrate-binding protein
MALAGCGSAGFSGVYNLPLPGGADLGDHPYTVTAEFADVLDLVPQAAVKVNNVAVGRVTKIDLPAQGWTARVTMRVNGSVRLPANASARLKQSSLLGEKYVELTAPATGAASEPLADGATIPLSRTNRNTEVEEVLGALSMLLNGGGIAQIHTISTELTDAMRGNEPRLRDVLNQLDTLLSNLDSQKQRITAALDGLDRLSATLAARTEQIGTVLDDLAPGLRVLDEQRDAFVEMLQALDRLSGVAVRTINASQEDFVADLKALQPILRQLANAGQALPRALEVLLTYPFTDAVLDGIKGDYLNIYLSVVAQPGTTVIAPLVPEGPVDPGADPPGGGSPQGGAGSPTPPPLPLPGIAGPTVGSLSPGATSGSPSSSGSPSFSGAPGSSGSPSSGASSGSPSSGSPSSGSSPSGSSSGSPDGSPSAPGSPSGSPSEFPSGVPSAAEGGG